MSIKITKPNSRSSFGNPTTYYIKTLIEKEGYRLEIQMDNTQGDPYVLTNGKLKLFLDDEDISHEINTECDFDSLTFAMDYIQEHTNKMALKK